MADTNSTAGQGTATGQAGAAAADAANTMGDRAREMGDRMKQGGQQIAQGGQDLGLKLLDQAETNTREAFKAMRDAAQAKDVSEVMKIQGDYLREAGSRSVTQAREIGELIASFGRSAMGQFTGRS